MEIQNCRIILAKLFPLDLLRTGGVTKSLPLSFEVRCVVLEINMLVYYPPSEVVL